MSPHFLIRLHKKRDATLATLGKERNPHQNLKVCLGKITRLKEIQKKQKKGVLHQNRHIPTQIQNYSTPRLEKDATLHAWKRTQPRLEKDATELGKGRNPSQPKIESSFGKSPQINTPDKTRNPRKRTQPRMAPAHSKHLICLIGTPNENTKYVNDFNTKHEGTISDHHCWCENAYGEVVDTSPIKITEESCGKKKKDRWYQKWEDQEGELKKVHDQLFNDLFKNSAKGSPQWKKLLDGNFEDTPENRKKVLDKLYEVGEYKTPLMCTLNALVVATARPDLKVVIGSFGWKTKKSKKGITRPVIDVHWGQ